MFVCARTCASATQAGVVRVTPSISCCQLSGGTRATRTFRDDGLEAIARPPLPPDVFFPPPSRRSDEESLQETTQERTSGPSRERNEGVVWCSSPLDLPQTFGADSFIPRLSFCVSLLPSILGNCNAVCLCRTASIVMLKTAVEKKKKNNLMLSLTQGANFE